jgi:serine/threonine-protein kinase
MRGPAISPNGRQLAFESLGTRWETWIADSVRNTTIRLAADTYEAGFPEWLDEGRSLGFGCGFSSKDSDSSFCVGSADGNGKTEQILPVGEAVGFSVSPDQKSILFAKQNEAGRFEIWRAAFQKGAKPELFLSTQFNELAPRISPRGGYVAYQSDESGNYQVYVRPFPTGEGRWMISTNGGTTPRWSPKGDELFYLEGDTLMAVSVQVFPSFKPGAPHALFSGKKVGSTLLAFDQSLYDVAPDGKRFVVIRDQKTGLQSSIILEQGWFAGSQ